jgi:hypothetical protein
MDLQQVKREIEQVLSARSSARQAATPASASPARH